LAVLMLLFWRKAVAEKRPARILVPALTVFLFGVMFLYGCNGGYGGGGTKPPTNATLTITGSSSGVSRTITLSLTINH